MRSNTKTQMAVLAIEGDRVSGEKIPKGGNSVNYTLIFIGLNIHLVPIFVKIIQFDPYFRCLFNLVLIFVKSHSIDSFWQTVLKLLTESDTVKLFGLRVKFSAGSDVGTVKFYGRCRFKS